jgi:hypothetical protein
MPGKRPQLNFDIDAPLKRQFRAVVDARGETVRDVLMRTVLEYVQDLELERNEEPKHEALPAKEPSSIAQIDDAFLLRVIKDKRHRKWFEMLARILDSGNKKATDAVIRNLDTFDDYVKVKGAESERRARK